MIPSPPQAIARRLTTTTMSPSWCPACSEICPPQPDGICTTCGEKLTSTPANVATIDGSLQSRSSPSRPTRQLPEASAVRAMALLASSIQSSDVHPGLPLVRREERNETEGSFPGDNVDTTRNDGNGGLADDLASFLPPEALDPQAGQTTRRPASQKALNDLKRIVLAPNSAELFDARVSLSEPRPIAESPRSSTWETESRESGGLNFHAVPGEFGPLPSFAENGDALPETETLRRIGHACRSAALVVCSPLTAKGGKLSHETLSEIATLRRHRMPFVAYVERGDGITFVRKALLCQRAGESDGGPSASESLCVGVIVGNAASGSGKKEVWPYVMQDTKNEAQTFGLKVPVVMIRREDGRRLVHWATKKRKDSKSKGSIGNEEKECLHYTPCRIRIHSKQPRSHTCPVCTDSFVPGATIVRLPFCGHVFHESCVLSWLTQHNTCPYCRRELPTDDEEYETERRRREALGSNAGDTVGTDGPNFYG